MLIYSPRKIRESYWCNDVSQKTAVIVGSLATAEGAAGLLLFEKSLFLSAISMFGAISTGVFGLAIHAAAEGQQIDHSNDSMLPLVRHNLRWLDKLPEKE